MFYRVWEGFLGFQIEIAWVVWDALLGCRVWADGFGGTEVPFFRLAQVQESTASSEFPKPYYCSCCFPQLKLKSITQKPMDLLTKKNTSLFVGDRNSSSHLS